MEAEEGFLLAGQGAPLLDPVQGFEPHTWPDGHRRASGLPQRGVIRIGRWASAIAYNRIRPPSQLPPGNPVNNLPGDTKEAANHLGIS